MDISGKWVAIASIFGIVAMECVALFNGINGVMLSAALTSVAGIGGYWLGAGKGAKDEASKEGPSSASPA